MTFSNLHEEGHHGDGVLPLRNVPGAEVLVEVDEVGLAHEVLVEDLVLRPLPVGPPPVEVALVEVVPEAGTEGAALYVGVSAILHLECWD